jgi:hypothetical protein
MPGAKATLNGRLMAELEDVKADAEEFSKPGEGSTDGDDEVRS